MFSKRCHLHQSLGISSSLVFCIQFCIHFYDYKHVHQKPIGMCLICFLVTKSPWRRKGFIWLSDPCHVHVTSTSRPITEGRTEAEIAQEHWWLAWPPWLTLLSYTTQDHLTRNSTPHNRLGPPPSVIKQENAPQTCPQASLKEPFWGSLFSVSAKLWKKEWLTPCQLDTQTRHY